jgi:membrane protease subunit HflK
MARSEEASSDEKVRRSVGRTIANVTTLLVSVAVIGAWASFGYYELKPGESAVILRLGRYARTVSAPGPKLHLPPPLETHEIVNTAALEREDFGYRGASQTEPDPKKVAEAAMQTRGNNIVHVGFEVQYRIRDPFLARYRVAAPGETLRDAAQAAVREVIGTATIDGVLSDRRSELEQTARRVLQQILDYYETGLVVDQLLFKDVQPPPQVQQAFDDVIAAIQDRNRKVNEAQGYANEVLPRARARAKEALAAAHGYRDALVAEATGEAERFRAVATEYLKAPDVIRTRLYLETMEAVLPNTRTIIMEPGTAFLPYMPLLGEPERAEEKQ